MTEFDNFVNEDTYSFVKCEGEEENRAFFWFKPTEEELNSDNKFLVILNYEVEVDEDGDESIVWGDFHAICVGEETHFPEEIREGMLNDIYDIVLEYVPDSLE